MKPKNSAKRVECAVPVQPGAFSSSDFRRAQQALFEVQKYHLQRAAHADRFIAIYERDLARPRCPQKHLVRQGIRRHKCERLKHLNFINAITPFLLPP